MKTLGLIGGMSWESTAEYYRLINQGVRDANGPMASAQLLVWSFNFADIAALQTAGDWDTLTALMVGAALKLEAAGADALMICTNTMHKCAPAIEAKAAIRLIHIADPTGAAIADKGLTRVGLLGTRFTMEQDFYTRRLAERFGLDVIVPDEPDRALVHAIIYDELVAGRIEPNSRETYRGVMQRMADRGAQAIVLGCTEIMLLVGAGDSPVPLFDTTALHAQAGIALALS